MVMGGGCSGSGFASPLPGCSERMRVAVDGHNDSEMGLSYTSLPTAHSLLGSQPPWVWRETVGVFRAHLPWERGWFREQSRTPARTSLLLLGARGGSGAGEGRATAAAETALTLHIAHAVLADHPSVVLLVRGPLVDEHGRVGGPGVQHDAVLQAERWGSAGRFPQASSAAPSTAPPRTPRSLPARGTAGSGTGAAQGGGTRRSAPLAECFPAGREDTWELLRDPTLQRRAVRHLIPACPCKARPFSGYK